MIQHLASKRIGRLLGKVVEKGWLNAAPVVIHYVDKVAPAPDFDANVESTYPATVEKTVRVSGLVHIVSARTVQRQFAEVQAGDAMVTFEKDLRDLDNPNNDTNIVDLDAMDKVRFELPGGGIYVQAVVGKDLAKLWEIVAGGAPLAKTILLKLSD
jgi:hypothetical protein